MLNRLNHIAIAVPNLASAAKKYESILGAKVSKPYNQPDHGVQIVFVELENVFLVLLGNVVLGNVVSEKASVEFLERRGI